MANAKQSDELSDEENVEAKGVPCASCLDNNENTSAGYYCIECEMYLCAKCLTCHNKFPQTKSHQVNEVDLVTKSPDLIQWTMGPKQIDKTDQPIVTCHIHVGKVFESYCKEHEQLCCETCVLVTHRTCGVEKISITAKDFKNTPEISRLKTSVSNILTDLGHEVEIRRRNLADLDVNKIQVLNEVDRFEEDIIKSVTQLAEVSRKQVRNKYEEQKTDIENELAILKASIATMKEYNEAVLVEDDEELFMNVETRKLQLQECRQNLQELPPACMKGIQIHFDECFKKCFEGMQSFGTIGYSLAIQKYECSPVTKMTCFKQGDHFKTSVYDMVVLKSGDILLADYDGRALKRFLSDCTLKESLDLNGTPDAVCQLCASEVAVRIRCNNNICMISVDDSMKIIRSFEVQRGDGMTYDAISEEFYVCEESNVSVYSKAGVKLRTYGTTSDGEVLFIHSWQVLLDITTRNIFVTDTEKGLVILRPSGDLKFRHSSIQSAKALCKLPGDIFIVNDWQVGRLVQIDRYGHELGVLLEDIYANFAVYDNINSRLFVRLDESVDMYRLQAIYQQEQQK